MDHVKARDLEKVLRGKAFDGWTIEEYVNHGKSAAVFRGVNGTETSAVKIFDDELISKYGDGTQLKRIEGELTLVGQHHPNMVKILSGGFDVQTNSHYIVMEYIDGPNLADCLHEVPNENIASLIKQLASAAKFLEDLGLCHRDIKPENVAILHTYRCLKLLDFGVLRPVGFAGLTDDDYLRVFVGTLQYSSPEFLLRAEEDSTLGWRSLTFSQIGGVLHDLIMKRPLFDEFSAPFVTLVNAVQFEQPKIASSTVPGDLIELAGRCSLKDWRVRSDLVRWEDFDEPGIAGSTSSTTTRQRVTNRVALARAQHMQKEDIADVQSAASAEGAKSRQFISEVIELLKSTVRSIRHDNAIFPPANITRSPMRGKYLKVRFNSSPELH